MMGYCVRRLLYLIPILIGVNLFTFGLFFYVNSPDDMARLHLGLKYDSPQSVRDWKVAHGYDKPLFWNPDASGVAHLTDTLFYDKSLKLFAFDFGLSDSGRHIGQALRQRAIPSLSLAIPALILGVLTNITVALGVVFFRYTWVERLALVGCILLLSISALFYIILGQFLLAKWARWFPISGYADGIASLRFICLPVVVSVLIGLGSGVRWYRALFMEAMHQDCVTVARAQGLSERLILFRYVLKNAAIPIITNLVVLLPLLFMGSLLMESFFGIPGLGSYTIDAIQAQDFAILRAIVFLGTILYMLGLLLSDLAYVWVDPRVRLSA